MPDPSLLRLSVIRRSSRGPSGRLSLAGDTLCPLEDAFRSLKPVEILREIIGMNSACPVPDGRWTVMKGIAPTFAVLFLALLCQPVQACSWFSIPPIEIPKNVYAFEGVVRRIVPAGETAALEVKVTVPLIGVKKGALVRVLVFGTGADCRRVNNTTAELQEYYPRGKSVAVIGRTLLLKPEDRLATVLVWEREGDYLGEGGRPAPAGVEIPNYRALVSEDRYQDAYQYLRLLVDLGAAESGAETARILRQMIPFTLPRGRDHFGELAARYAKSEGQRKELMADYEQAYRQVHKLDAPQRTGTRAESIKVELQEGQLRIDDSRIDFPVKISFVEELLGPPSSTAPAAKGDKYSIDLLEWEHLGFYLYSEPGSGEGQALGIALAPDLNSRGWETGFSGMIVVNGVEIGRFSEGEDLERAGFERESEYAPWRVRSHSLSFLLMTYPEPPQITDVEFSLKR